VLAAAMNSNEWEKKHNEPEEMALDGAAGRVLGDRRQSGLRELAGPDLHLPADRGATALSELLPAQPRKAAGPEAVLHLPADGRAAALSELLPAQPKQVVS